MIKELTKYVKGLKQYHIDSDVELEIISGFGGMCCGYCKVSEVIEIINSEEREINRDYFICLPNAT